MGTATEQFQKIRISQQKLLNLKLKAGYLTTAHTEFRNHIY